MPDRRSIHGLLAAAVCATVLWPVWSLAAPDVEALVRKADQAHGGQLASGLQMSGTITSYQRGAVSRSYTVQIEAQDGNSLISFREPAFARGNKMLVRQRNMWFVSADIKQPVPISPRQRLVGEAANGDIATTNFSRDYNARLLDDSEVAGEPCHAIELTAKTQNTSYDRIVYHVSKARQIGLRAEYYSLSNKLLKTADIEYRHEIRLNGVTQPFVSRMEIRDALTTDERTVLEYTRPELKAIAASQFDLQTVMLSH